MESLSLPCSYSSTPQRRSCHHPTPRWAAANTCPPPPPPPMEPCRAHPTLLFSITEPKPPLQPQTEPSLTILLLHHRQPCPKLGFFPPTQHSPSIPSTAGISPPPASVAMRCASEGGVLTGSRKDLIGYLVGLRLSEEVLLRGSGRKGIGRGGRTVCAAPAAFNPQTLHWISAVSTVVLMFAKGTPILKSFLAPLFTLQAPASLVAWLKSEYGTWTAVLALLVRLFYSAPEEMELPFIAMLLTITAPSETLNLRGTPAAAIISLLIAGYLAYQYFSKMGGVENAFDSVSIVPTLALIAAVDVPCFLLFIY